MPWDEVIRLRHQSGHTRIPAYNRSPDDIVGILHTKDLLAELAKPESQARQPWQEILRKPFFVPETKPVDELLQEFQRSRNQIAVVLDEFGGVSGLVTIEDALEEIVGEIADEHDKHIPTASSRSANMRPKRWPACEFTTSTSGSACRCRRTSISTRSAASCFTSWAEFPTSARN